MSSLVSFHFPPLFVFVSQTLRGLKTMALRMERQQSNAVAMANFLAAHPLVKRVNFPGLPGHPGKAAHDAQAQGPGSILSFETGDVAVSKAIVEGAKLFKARFDACGCALPSSLFWRVIVKACT